MSDTNIKDIYELAEQVLKAKPLQEADPKERPLVISADERRRLETLLGRNLSSGQELIHMVEKATTVSLDNIRVELTPYLLERLKSRAIRVDWDKFIPMTIKRLLEEYAGIR